MTGRSIEFPEDEKSHMREMMENVPPEIFKAIQKSLEEYDDGE